MWWRAGDEVILGTQAFISILKHSKSCKMITTKPDRINGQNARELAMAAHFEDFTHMQGYLNVNNCKELDLEIAKDTEFRY